MSEPNAHSLVVGGTRGIGRAVVRVLASAGHRLSVLGRRAPASPEPGARYWTADLQDREGTRRALEDVVGSAGPLSHIVCLQRYRGQGDGWEGEIDVTLRATRDLVDQLSGHLTGPGSRAIVLVSSVIGTEVIDSQPLAYHVAKAGLEHMVRYYAVKLGPSGVRVNGVSPCTVLKDESRHVYVGNEPLHALYRRLIPLGRMGESEEVARVVAFLCSAEASFMTGQNLVVDGGLSLVWPETLARRMAGLE
jgi:NAD(P)-dependent dehydrogenase (short-subunit alcohol dehydrogenase family)